MAERQRMTIEQVVSEVMASEHADVLREAVRLVAQELMEADVTALIGAAHGERNPDGRMTQRNGYRGREWDTRAGVIELEIPKLRRGSYFPHGLLEPRKRGEQALVSVVQQASVCGVSTRRVDQLVESLGLRISRSEVSRVCALLDEQVDAFRQRPVEATTRSVARRQGREGPRRRPGGQQVRRDRLRRARERAPGDPRHRRR